MGQRLDACVEPITPCMFYFYSMKNRSAMHFIAVLTGLLLFNWACTKDKALPISDLPPTTHTPTPYELNLPPSPPTLYIPAGNPMTEEGVNLGHRLFFDPLLSGDNTMSCATCHSLASGTSDSRTFSVGIDGTVGRRNAMPLFNLAFQEEFFWDGRAIGLEMLVLMPIEDHTEMKESLPNLLRELSQDPLYPKLFWQAFGTDTITGDYVAKAIAQYLRALTSFNSTFDSSLYYGTFLDDDVVDGLQLFQSLVGADCIHCHGGGNKLFGDFKYRNNGLTAAATIEDFPDAGRGEVTGNPSDYGTFKTPSLRNVALTAPYMHDGRFATLEEVLDHYSEGLQVGPNINRGELEFVDSGGVGLTVKEKAAVIAFLHSLTDNTIQDNPLYRSPF